MSQERQSLIGTTYFFREVNLFQTALDIAKNNDISEIVSVGCSTGEEVYSLAYLAGRNNTLKFKGVDVDQRRIKTAQNGEYVFDTTNNTSPRWLVSMNIINELCSPIKSANNYRIDVPPDIRNRTQFSVHDMAKAPLPEPVQLIICANVLMHYWAFTNEDKSRSYALQRHLFKSLKPNGYLVTDRYSYEEYKEYVNPNLWLPQYDVLKEYPQQPLPTYFDLGMVLKRKDND